MSYRLDKSVGQQLSGFSVCTPRRELRVCLQVNPGVKARIQILVKFVPKKSLKAAPVTHSKTSFPQCHETRCTELKSLIHV